MSLGENLTVYSMSLLCLKCAVTMIHQLRPQTRNTLIQLALTAFNTKVD